MKDRWKKNGYTILEMTIVISIISLIITIVMLNISKQRDEARDRAVMIQMENLRIAINNYRVINDGILPKTLHSLSPKFMPSIPKKWYGSRGYGEYRYNPKTGDIGLKILGGKNIDCNGRAYATY
jgi:prepilin-type N-terminal cleavage/methylation domain-containing protein